MSVSTTIIEQKLGVLTLEGVTDAPLAAASIVAAIDKTVPRGSVLIHALASAAGPEEQRKTERVQGPLPTTILVTFPLPLDNVPNVTTTVQDTGLETQGEVEAVPVPGSVTKTDFRLSVTSKGRTDFDYVDVEWAAQDNTASALDSDDVSVSESASASDESQSGTVHISGGSFASTPVTFPLPFASVPDVITTVADTDPEATEGDVEASPTNITVNGFDITVTSVSGTTYNSTDIDWTAIGPISGDDE